MTSGGSRDLELVRRVLGRDAAAVAALAQRLECIGRFVRYLNRRTARLRDADLEDLEQEVVAIVWQRLRDYAGTARLESWVFPFCHNVLRNAGRQQRRQRQRQEVDADSELAAVAAPRAAEPFDPGPVFECLEVLPPEDQEILRQKHFGGVTLQDLAVRLGMNLNTLKSRYCRALARVRDCCERRTEGGQEGQS